MKKIYSIVLMAVALFMGTNAMAVQVPVSDFTGLQSAFTSHLTDAEETIEIQLGGTIDMATTIYVRDGKHYVVDLKGYNITASFGKLDGMGSYPSMFYVVHGTLEFKNSGDADDEHGKVMQTLNKSFVVSMSGAGYTYAKNQDESLSFENMPNVANWSNLIIGKGVQLRTTGSVEGKAVTIYNLGASYLHINGAAPTYNAKGKLTNGYSNQYKRDLIVDPATGEKGLKIYDNGSEIDYVTTKGTNNTGVAKGVTVLVKKGATVYGGEYGVQISGVIGYQDNSDYRPVITIEDGATVQSSSAAKSTAVYAAGYGVINIAGEVTGATGVYIKGGEVNISDNAKITSNAEAYAKPVPTSSGVDASGSAIVYETNPSYVGDININVSGNSTIGSKDGKGYAIEGSQPVAVDPELKVLNIQGGTIVAGEEGTMETKALQDAINGGATFVVDGVQITNTDAQTINALIELAGNNQVVAQTEDGKYVIENKPAGVEIKTDGSVNVNDANAFVEWNTKGKEETVDGDREIGYLSMCENSKLTIPVGTTLKAGSIVMHSTAVIDVQAGGKLVITGKKGLVANQKGNIKLYVTKDAKSIFMLTPAADANKNPAATVELTTDAYKNNGERVWQRMGVPAANGIKVSEIVKGSTVSYYLFYWGATEQDWVQITNASYVLQPFQGLELTNDATAAGQTYKFPCDLMGNTNAELPLIGEWTSFANSYMAEIDLYAMMQDVMDDPGSAASATTYVNDVDNNDQWPVVTWASLDEWKNDGAEAPEHTALKPMQGFILRNKDAATNTSATINYNNSVWAPVFGSAQLKAARNRAMAKTATTRVKINITAENGMKDAIILREGEDYTPAFENGYDAEKNLKVNEVSIYATTEIGNMAEVSTDNLDGLKLNVESKNETSFMMTFSNLKGEQMAIRDNLTGATITMVEGAEYFFTATEGDNANRFEIIAVKNAPTDVETVVETTGAKAVYTVLGQYMGTTDNWNTLPNGIYVVDGVKMVK
jgi:hypothetical protein